MNINEAFRLSKYKDIIINLDDIFLPLDPKWKKISINLSGGADSAILSYLLCNEIFEKKLDIEIHIISNIRMWKSRPWQRFDSIRVFNFLKNNFPLLKLFRYENFIAPEIEYGNIGPIIQDEYGRMKSGDQISTRSFVEYFIHYHNINAHYAGLTKNPDDQNITQRMPDRNINFNDIKDLDNLIFIYNDVYICHPFRFTMKDKIIKKYKDLNLLNLLAITRSCEGDNNIYPEIFNGLDYKNYKEGLPVPECNKCFWCQERKWALTLNKLL